MIVNIERTWLWIGHDKLVAFLPWKYDYVISSSIRISCSSFLWVHCAAESLRFISHPINFRSPSEPISRRERCSWMNYFSNSKTAPRSRKNSKTNNILLYSINHKWCCELTYTEETSTLSEFNIRQTCSIFYRKVKFTVTIADFSGSTRRLAGGVLWPLNPANEAHQQRDSLELCPESPANRVTITRDNERQTTKIHCKRHLLDMSWLLRAF